ncbi:phage-like tail assembly protein K [Glaesserella parasuis gx033]|nr:phage-like tail assembly protein K [Glaesserella parasuis gx033]
MQNISFTEQILYHAKRSEPHESCGFVVFKGGELRYFPCENVAVDPINHFEISPDDWIRAESVGEIVAVVHCTLIRTRKRACRIYRRLIVNAKCG